MIVVTFALPQESQDFRRALLNLKEGPRRALRPLAQVRSSTPGELALDRESRPEDSLRSRVRIFHTGVGLAAAERAMAELLSAERPQAVISSGFAGALVPKLKLADLVVATNISSPDLAAACREIRASPASCYFGSLSTQAAAVESIADKANLGSTTGALAVDMEASAIAAACQSRGIPFLSVRAISDSAHDPLPVPFEVWFNLEKQRPRALNLVSYLAAHPDRIGPFTRFVRGLKPARMALTSFLIELLKREAL